ncbi:PIG-L deacetylase family protein [Rugamonas sp. CCM 8940]|uniref:PIG-L deacetylase family protein n=1 Tax=Rugamonas sp. CCM 8940 TaxID=2765359 RepID=UPI0018F35E2B|nr:PIG-L family deacetylase [Rugamonas sp. CCM 8940]MBJ7311500.1 PIG-L family deacetylase [Rugamonas sp. CCM 8940]
MNPPSLEALKGRRILLLSPHADDVAYSIGGIVARLATQADILLMTVFGRSGWALPQALCAESADAVSAVREQEDRAYCARRRIDYALLPCPDSFLMGYDEATELSAAAAADDPRTADIVKLIGDAVARLLPHIVLAPCGLGGHVDHQIVRLAADALERVEVLYYEDLPYSAGLPLAELDRQLSAQGLVPKVTADIEIVLEGKCADMWGYRSQTSEATIAEMLLHAGRVGKGGARYAERLWCRVN